MGDDEEFEEVSKERNYGILDKAYMYFTDSVVLAWNGKPLEFTKSETIEMYIGPALMCFHIPFTLSTIKIFVSTTPVEGGSIMRVRTYLNSSSFLTRFIGWMVMGVSASQLAADIMIMANKVRHRKPFSVAKDGPLNRTSSWLKQFYSESSSKVGQGQFTPDW